MVETYLIYNSILVCGFLILFLASNLKHAEYKTLFFIVLFIMWLPAAFRYGIGRDYFTYVSIYLHPELYENIEPGYLFLMKILSFFGADAQVVFFVTSFITYLFCLLSFDKKNVHICFLVYMCIVYLGTYSIVRQMMAMSILMYSVRLWILNRRVWSFLWLLVSISIHSSMIFAIPIYLFSFCIQWSLRNQLVVIFVTMLFFVFNLIDIVLQSSLFAQTKYFYYADSDFFNKTNIGSGAGFIIKLSIPLMLICMTEKIRNLDRNYNVLFLFNLSYICFLIMSLNIYIFTRLADVFSFSVVLSAGLIYQNVKGINKLILVGLLFMNVVLFESNINVGTIANGLKTGSGLGIAPYSSM